MPFEYEFAFRPAVAQLTVSGAPDLAEWRVAIGAIVRHPDLPVDAPLLCDLRHVRALPRNRDGRAAVQEWLELVPARRVAFVAGRSTAPRIAAELRRRSLAAFEVFTEYERALRWLVFHLSFDAVKKRSRTRLSSIP
jgi:hypothetical protein